MFLAGRGHLDADGADGGQPQPPPGQGPPLHLVFQVTNPLNPLPSLWRAISAATLEGVPPLHPILSLKAVLSHHITRLFLRKLSSPAVRIGVPATSQVLAAKGSSLSLTTCAHDDSGLCDIARLEIVASDPDICTRISCSPP